MTINYELVTDLGTKRGGKGGEYFKAGHNFHAVIEKCEWKKARSGVEFVIVDFQVLESDCDEQGPGRKPTFMINMNQDAGAGNLADFLRYSLARFAKITEGVDISPDDDSYWEGILEDRSTLVSVLEEEQMLVGTDIWLYTKPIKTKTGKDFTIHSWAMEPTIGKVHEASAE